MSSVHLGKQWLLKIPEWTSETLLQRMLNREQHESSLYMNFYAIPFKNLPKLQALAGIPTGCPNPCQPWRMWPHIISTMCSVAHYCCWYCDLYFMAQEGTYALKAHRQAQVEWPYEVCLGTQINAVPYAAERTQCRTRHVSVARWATEEKEQLGNRRRFGTSKWAWGYRWTLSETSSNLGWFFYPPQGQKTSWWQFNTNIP